MVKREFNWDDKLREVAAQRNNPQPKPRENEMTAWQVAAGIIVVLVMILFWCIIGIIAVHFIGKYW